MENQPLLYIAPEQVEPLEILLERFKYNPTELKSYLWSEAMLKEAEFKPLYSMSKEDILYAYYEGYETHRSPNHALAHTLQRWQDEHTDMMEGYSSFAEAQLLWGRIQGARHVLRTLGIKLPQQEEN